MDTEIETAYNRFNVYYEDMRTRRNITLIEENVQHAAAHMKARHWVMSMTSHASGGVYYALESWEKGADVDGSYEVAGVYSGGLQVGAFTIRPCKGVMK